MRNFANAIFVPSKAKNFSIAIATVKFFFSKLGEGP